MRSEMYSAAVPRKSVGERICRRLIPWLPEIGLTEPARARLIESWSHLRTMKEGRKEGSRMIVEHRFRA